MAKHYPRPQKAPLLPAVQMSVRQPGDPPPKRRRKDGVVFIKNISKTTHRYFKMYCKRSGYSMTAVLEFLMQDFVRRERQAPGAGLHRNPEEMME